MEKELTNFRNGCSVALFALATSFGVSTTAFADATYVSDQGHTEVRFSWDHAGVTIQHGEFDTAVGTLNWSDDIESSSISVVIDAASVSSGFEALDTHLKSEDFLEVETYPEMTFESTSVEKTGENTMEITGDLTIHGVTNSVVLEAEMTLLGDHPLGGSFDYYKGDWIAFQAGTTIDHQAFEVGGFSTGPISIEISTEMKAK